MPDHESAALLSRQTKRRRVDIGVKRTIGTASVLFAHAKATLFSGMNPHGSEQDVECSVVQRVERVDGEKSNVLRKLLKRANSYEDTLMPFPGATIISQLLKNNMTKNGGTEAGFPGSGLSSAGSEVHQEDTCSTSSHESPRECLSPFGRPALTQLDVERLSDEHLRAKRARVENIIRGMSHSPSVALRAGEGERDGVPQPASPRESYRENKRKQRLPQQQQQQQQQQGFQNRASDRSEHKQQERRQLKLQLEDMQKQLRQLQEKFYQIYDSSDSEHDEEGNLSEDSVRSDGVDHRVHDPAADRSDNDTSDLDPGNLLDRARAVTAEGGDALRREGPRGKGPGAGQPSMRTEGRRLAETLKQELNSAMAQVVDTVVKVFAKPPHPAPQVFPPLPLPPERFAVNGDGPDFQAAGHRLQCFSDVVIPNPLDPFSSGPIPSSNDQTEALPLVVRRSTADQSSSLPTPVGHHHPSLHPSPLSATMGFSPPSFRHPFPLPLMGYPFQNSLGTPSSMYLGKERSSPESLDLSRETSGLRTKMSSNHLTHHRSCSPAHPGSTSEGLSLSLIKSECGDLQDMSDISPYSGSTISFLKPRSIPLPAATLPPSLLYSL
ncbi:hypothetical protein AAFF_G00361620 [Aldrovandia affinis]|uniref:Uncharacterized protein n=1 Tax=Aldrovandia affinis TaxID=143900 RepID=A0AAD7SHX2_9TELE|nr:hypothetical protein AAFF_G00361620 [Aldrovandia affinis]